MDIVDIRSKCILFCSKYILFFDSEVTVVRDVLNGPKYKNSFSYSLNYSSKGRTTSLN